MEIPCDRGTKAGDPLTTPDGLAVIATSHAQDAGAGAWMCSARPMVTAKEYHRLFVANGFGECYDTMEAVLGRLWAAYWKQKQARPAKAVKREPVAMG